MRYYLLALLFWGCYGIYTASAQSVNFEDGFEDDNFNANPAWSGDTDEFTVITDGSNHLLQLQGNPAGGVSYLSVPSTEITGSWEFYINLDFSPSGSNFAEIFLMSDLANLENAVNGYVLQSGEGGSSDVFRIVRYDNGNPGATVLSGTTDISSGGAFRVRVTRNTSGDWTLEVGLGYAGSLQQEATGNDNTYTSATHFGVKATYTSSRANLFFFDFEINLPPFTITDAVANSSQITVSFNRAYDQSTVQVSDFNVNNGIGSPVSLSFPTATTVQLNFGNPFDSDRYTLTAQTIDDVSGNPLAANAEAMFTVYTSFSVGDVVLNEFMYDPPPGQAEYIELKNVTDNYLNLQNWQLSDDSGTAAISTDTLTLPPNSFLVISGDTTALNLVYGPRPYAQMNDFPSLNNGGDTIDISTGANTQVDSLHYSPAWGGENTALERRSDTAPSVQANFGNSPNPLGGTPGTANEVDEDTIAPGLNNLTINDKITITLVFTEGLQSGPAGNAANFILNNSITVTNTQQIAPDSVRLSLNSPLQNNTTYQLSINNQQDIFGNVASIDTSFTYYEILPAGPDDIFINEFMYDPPAGSTEYIELYNPTEKSLNLQGWSLNDSSGEPAVITDSQVILPPDSYVIIAPDRTILSRNPDMLLITMGSDFPSFNNGGDVIVIRDSGSIELDSLQYSSGWGGSDIALERRTTDVPPVEANFGEAPNGFGTPGMINQIEEDANPPSLVSFAILTNQTLEFIFDEPLEAASATDENNYNISSELNIAAAFLNRNTVSLKLSAPLQNNTQYTVTIENITDLFGNTASTIDTAFTYLEASPVDEDDIYINEFMYDPPSGQTEYIELRNTANKSLNLQGWTLNDNSGDPIVITENQFIIPPKSFIVLAPDGTLLDDFPDIILLQVGSNFPSFNNNGDDIIISSSGGLLLDSLRYTDDWGGREIALERRTIEAPPVKNNFGNAPNAFGTPGSENGIQPDETPPTLSVVDVLNASTIQLLFSETITGSSATNISNYSISPVANIQLISAIKDSVTLFLSGTLESEQVYQLTIKNLEDIFGNTMAEINREISFVEIVQAQPEDIIINEFLVAGEPEFIELYNKSDKNIDLSGWSIGDQNNITEIGQEIAAGKLNSGRNTAANIEQSLILKPGQFLVITSSASLANLLDNGIYESNLPSFNDNEDVIYIKDSSGLTIDSLSYTPAFGAGVTGVSAERKDPSAASNDASNWASGSTDTGHTAGIENSIFQPDTQPPAIIFSKLFPNGDIEVRFNEFITLTTDLVFIVNDQQVELNVFDPSNGNSVILNTSESIAGGQVLTVSAQNVSDVSGNVNPSTEIAVAQPLSPGDVVINEIMFDPIADAEDGLPDQSEYLELYNIRDYAISLEGITIHNAPDEDGDIDRLEPVTTRSKWISPGGTALIYAGETAAFSQSNIARFFGLSNPPSRALIRIEGSTLSLSSTGDAVYLSGTEGEEIDSVFYNETWHNPNIIDTDGIALERINPEGPGNNASNWGSSTAAKGGTPLAENTLFQTPKNKPDETGISFSSNPFSPDGDGFEDHLIISYKLDRPDYLMSVHIYDRYGRLIIELADSQPAGSEGSLIWKGLKENGSRNRIGIYIIIFEAFDSSGGSDVAFKETVVLARRFH